MSATHVIFVRAMNTGGRRLTNEEQTAPLIAAGFSDVSAYQAAGNLVVSTDRAVDERHLDELLTAAYGFETLTIVRTVDQLRDVARRQPFGADQIAATAGRVQVAFVRDPPSGETIRSATALVPPDDLVEFVGSEWFWLPQDGISTSALPVATIERLVGTMTIRTLGTVERLLKKFA